MNTTAKRFNPVCPSCREEISFTRTLRAPSNFKVRCACGTRLLVTYRPRLLGLMPDVLTLIFIPGVIIGGLLLFTWVSGGPPSNDKLWMVTAILLAGFVYIGFKLLTHYLIANRGSLNTESPEDPLRKSGEDPPS